MRTLATAVAKFIREEDAPTMVEYALLVGGVALLAVVGVGQFGQVIAEFFRDAALIANVR
ncbi:MAG: Flp family type IVb pilin [Pirellulales bacterium]